MISNMNRVLVYSPGFSVFNVCVGSLVDPNGPVIKILATPVFVQTRGNSLPASKEVIRFAAKKQTMQTKSQVGP